MTPLDMFLTALSVVSITFGIVFGIRGALRENKKDTKDDASQMAIVVYKLDNISSVVNDIKADSKAFRLDIQDARERILILEQEYKSIHPMITEIRKSMYDNQED